MEILKSTKLDQAHYDIRGPVLDHAEWLEDQGQKVIKLNIGNPAAFGFDAPDEIFYDVIQNLRNAQGYSESKGLFVARKAVMQRYQAIGLNDIDVEDVIMGNGVSELIVMAMQALLNNGDEVLIPAPDYPLWTAATSISGGKPVHYLCDENDAWQPDLEDIQRKLTRRTRAIVIINPNNPTGAVYSKEMISKLVTFAEAHDLIVLADEIYDRVLYDDIIHEPIAKSVNNTLCLTFNGLSKTYRLAGFRSGWVVASGEKAHAAD